MRYINDYNIPSLSGYNISDGTGWPEDKKGFYIWYIGCRVGGPYKTQAIAKEEIAKRAINELKIKLEILKKNIKSIQTVLDGAEEYDDWIEDYRKRRLRL